jgi:hypothetical protein
MEDDSATLLLILGDGGTRTIITGAADITPTTTAHS